MTTETVALKENISPRTEKWIRISAVLAMIVVAVSSAVLSFDGLKKVALDAQIPDHLAFLFPIAVDTTILMGSLAVLLYELFGVRAVFGWITVLFGTLLSIIGNVISVKDAGLIAQVLHGIIPVLLCISLESLLRILRFNIKQKRLAHTPLPHLRDIREVKHDADSNRNSYESVEEPSIPSNVIVPDPVAVTPSPVSHLPAPVFTPVDVAPAPAPVPVEVPEAVIIPVETPVEEVPVVVPVPTPEAPESVSLAVEPNPEVTPVEPASAEEPKPAMPAQEPVKPAPAPKAPAAKPAPSKPAKSALSSSGNVTKYRIVLEAFPEETPKARKVAEILRSYPDASATDIKAALGDSPELRIDGTMRRAKEWLKKN